MLGGFRDDTRTRAEFLECLEHFSELADETVLLLCAPLDRRWEHAAPRLRIGDEQTRRIAG